MEVKGKIGRAREDISGQQVPDETSGRWVLSLDLPLDSCSNGAPWEMDDNRCENLVW